MPDLVELTLHDNRRVGIPRGTVILLLDVSKAEHAEAPKAKTLIRYTLGFGGKIAWVRDAYDQVLNLFPTAVDGLGWAHARNTDGAALAFPSGSIVAYEELEPKGTFEVTLDVPTGPISVSVQASFEEVKSMMGEKAPAPVEEAPVTRQHRRQARGKGG